MTHYTVIALAYWSSVAALFWAGMFITFLEFFALYKKVHVTVFTPGWLGLVPSGFLALSVLSAFTSVFSTCFSIWF